MGRSNVLAFLALVLFLIPGCSREADPQLLQTKYSALASSGSWAELEQLTRKSLADYTSLNWYNLSMAWQGRLVEDLFKVRQAGPWGLIYIPEGQVAAPCLAHVMYACGNMAAAQNLAFNALFTDKGIDKPMLRMLARIELMRGCDKVSRKYQRILGQTITEDQDIIRGRKDMNTVEEAFVLAGSPYEQILRILRSNPDDSLAMQYALGYLLLSKDLRTTKSFVEEFYGKGALCVLPVPAQEALLFYSEMTRNIPNGEDEPLGLEWCCEHGLQSATQRRFASFQQASIRSGGAAPAGFRDTFWHYYLYTPI